MLADIGVLANIRQHADNIVHSYYEHLQTLKYLQYYENKSTT